MALFQGFKRERKCLGTTKETKQSGKSPLIPMAKYQVKLHFFCFGKIVSVELERELKKRKDVFKHD